MNNSPPGPISLSFWKLTEVPVKLHQACCKIKSEIGLTGTNRQIHDTRRALSPYHYIAASSLEPDTSKNKVWFSRFGDIVLYDPKNITCISPYFLAASSYALETLAISTAFTCSIQSTSYLVDKKKMRGKTERRCSLHPSIAHASIQTGKQSSPTPWHRSPFANSFLRSSPPLWYNWTKERWWPSESLARQTKEDFW